VSNLYLPAGCTSFHAEQTGGKHHLLGRHIKIGQYGASAMPNEPDSFLDIDLTA